jgi:hypothetical protein
MPICFGNIGSSWGFSLFFGRKFLKNSLIITSSPNNFVILHIKIIIFCFYAVDIQQNLSATNDF